MAVAGASQPILPYHFGPLLGFLRMGSGLVPFLFPTELGKSCNGSGTGVTVTFQLGDTEPRRAAASWRLPEGKLIRGRN